MIAEHSVHYRLARHYAKQVQQANSALSQGWANQSHWLHIFQQDWAQIANWQSWTADWQLGEEERARLCVAFVMDMMEIYQTRQSPAEMILWVQQGLEAARMLQDVRAERTLMHQLGTLYLHVEDLDNAAEWAHQLHDLAEAAQDDVNIVRACSLLGAVYVQRGEYAEAEAHYRRSIALLSQVHTGEEHALIMKGLGNLAVDRGDYERAHDYFMSYLKEAQTSRLDRHIGAAHLHLSDVMRYLDRNQDAVDHARQALGIALRMRYVRMIPFARISLAHAESELGRLEEAVQHYEDALTAPQSLLPPSGRINALHGLAYVRKLQGNTNAAIEHYEAAVSMAREHKILFRLCEVATPCVDLYIAQGKTALAQARLIDAISSAIKLDTPYFMAKALSSAVLVYSYLRDYQQAATWSGLLSLHLPYINQSTFEAVCHDLEQQLGIETYTRIFGQGKQIDLRETLQTIALQLNG